MITSNVSAASATGSGQFLDVDWNSIALVCVTTLVAAVVIVTFYSVGLRLLAIGSPNDGEDANGSRVASAAGHRPLIATIGAVLCIGVGVAAVLYGIYLVIPLFHQ